LDAEYRHVKDSFDYEAAKWEARAAAVPVGVIPCADAEGAIAYAKRHAEMFRDLKARGEKTWTEEKIARGKRRPRHIPAVVGEMAAEARAEREESERAMAGLDTGEEVEEEGEESDEEYVLGGEGYD
jgi:hypothetical protein